jgi:hypothetical protein
LRCRNLWHPNPANFRSEIGVDMHGFARAAAVYYPLRRRTAQSTETTSLTYLIQYLAIRIVLNSIS